MALQDVPLDRIGEGDLLRLIEDGARETVVIDYKRDTYGKREKDHAEYLADVSSLANTSGGDLVVGIAEAEGKPTAIHPFLGDADAEVRRLEDMARGGLEPRLTQLTARAVPVAHGHVIVVRVRKSFTGPHRVVYQGRDRFWARGSTGRYEPDVAQLRRLFNEGQHLVDAVKEFRIERLSAIARGDLPIHFHWTCKLVVHVVPLAAYADDRFADVVSAVASGTHVPLPLTGQGANRIAVNIDGLLNSRDGPGQLRSYAQLFRSGAIEGVLEIGNGTDGSPEILDANLANTVVAGVRQYADVLNAMQAGEPVYALIALVGTTGARFVYGIDHGGLSRTDSYQRDQIVLPAVLLDPSRGDIPALLRPAFNTLWNAFGLVQCRMYRADGTWIGAT